MAAAASTSAWPIVVGPSFKQKGKATNVDNRENLISIKYNFRPPSIAQGPAKSGLLHCPKQQESEWLLEYAADSPNSSSNEERTAESSHAFSGTQTAARDVDCLLVWDDDRQAYVLERIASCFSMRYERKPTRLSAEAKRAIVPAAEQHSPRDDVEMAEADDEGQAEEGEIGDDFADQLQRDLDAQSGQTSPAVRPSSQEPGMSRSNSHTGLGLINAVGLHEEVITPRGSPYVDRTAKAFTSTSRNNDVMHSTHLRSTPAMSPVSAANSPRPTGLESSLSSTWRPPAQRSNVALTFDDEDEDEEEEDDSEEEEEDEEDEEDDEDDLDAFARELEGNLMDPSNVEEEQAEVPAPVARTRRASNRNRKQ